MKFSKKVIIFLGILSLTVIYSIVYSNLIGSPYTMKNWLKRGSLTVVFSVICTLVTIALIKHIAKLSRKEKIFKLKIFLFCFASSLIISVGFAPIIIEEPITALNLLKWTWQSFTGAIFLAWIFGKKPDTNNAP